MDCRRSGLEEARRCALLGFEAKPGSRPVWVRKDLVTLQCPKSVITPESEAMLVQFGMRKLIGDAVPLQEIDARVAEAMAVLEGEVRKEVDR